MQTKLALPFVILATCAMTVPSYSADQNYRIHGCAVVEPEKTAQCHVQTPENVTIKNLLINGEAQKLENEIKPYGQDRADAEVYILIDTSKSLDQNAFVRFKTIAQKVALKEQYRTAVYGFNRSLEAIAPIETPSKTTELAINSVVASGNSTEGYKAVYDLIQQIKMRKMSNRLIVILSDGEFEDSAYSAAEIIKNLNDENIRVLAVGPSASNQAVTNAQTIRRLATETSGEFLTATNPQTVDLVVNKIHSLGLAGGLITISPLVKTNNILVTFSNNQTKSINFDADIAPPIQNSDSNEYKAMIIRYSEKIGNYYEESNIQKLIVILSAIAIAIILIAPLALMIRRKRVKPELLSEPLDKIVEAHRQQPLALLEFLDGEGTIFDITKQTTTIGRHTDNDLVLKNTSVHRHHALLNKGPDGHLVIIDLETDNGILINGQRKEKSILKFGDLIELGEVRMRLRAA